MTIFSSINILKNQSFGFSSKTLLVVMCFLSMKTSYSQITFQKTYGDSQLDEGRSVIQTTDGGYIIAGITENFGAFNYGAYIIKTNPYGDTIFTKVIIGGTTAFGFYPRQIIQTSDKGFAIVGMVITGSPNYNIVVFKTDSNCVVQWERGYGEGNNDYGRSISQTNDGGFIITGQVFNVVPKACIIKTDGNGNTLWTKLYGGTSTESSNSILQSSDGGYVFAGGTNSYGIGGSSDMYLVKTNNLGDTLWSRCYGGLSGEEAVDFKETHDGGFILVGGTTSFGAGNRDIYLVKVDANGNLLWSKTFGGSDYDYAYSVIETFDSCFVITGYTNSFGVSNEDVYLIKADKSGSLLWSKTYGGTTASQYENAHSVRETNDKGYILAGWTTSFNSTAFGRDVYLIKTDQNGNSGCYEGIPNTITTSPSSSFTKAQTNSFSPISAVSFSKKITSGGIPRTHCSFQNITELKSSAIVRLFPNPFISELNIESDIFLTEATITIENSLGQIIEQIPNISGYSFVINRGGIKNGYYFLRITEKNKQISLSKLVIMD